MADSETPRARLARVLEDADYAMLGQRRYLIMADALLAAGVGAEWKCLAQRTADPLQDCDMPFCGCNPAWLDALTSAQESGWLPVLDAADLRTMLAQRDAEGQRLAGALAAAEGRVGAIKEAMRGAPMERLDTHGWIECVWCHGIREKRSAPETLPHDPQCGALKMRALLAVAP